MNVFDLFAKISLDTSGYESGIGKVAAGAKNAAATIGKVFTAAIGAATSAAAALTKTAISGASELAEYGDNIDKMSQKLGISAEAYQEWDAILQHSGASIDSMQSAIKTMVSAANTGNEAFARLGITEEELAKLSQEDLFARVISDLQEMGESTERTYIATELLGRGAMELGALLNTSAEDTEAMRRAVHDLGGVMSNEAVKSAALYQDTLQDMQTAFSGLKRGIMFNFMPAITTAMQGLTKIFGGNGDEGIQQLSDGINQFVQNIGAAASKVADSGGKIVLSLVDPIVENLPEFLTIGADVLTMLITGIAQKIPDLMPVVVQLAEYIGTTIGDLAPQLLPAAFALILQLAHSLAEALPGLIPTIVTIVADIAKTLTNPESIGMLVDAAIGIMMGLVDGIISAVPILLDAAPEIILNLVTAIVDNAPKLLDAAINIIFALSDMLTDPENLLKLIQAAVKIVGAIGQGLLSLVGDIPKIVSQIINKLIDSIAGHSEKTSNVGADIFNSIKDGILKNFEQAKEWGADLIKNFVEGIKSKFENFKKALGNIAGAVKDFLGFSEPEKGPLSNFHTYAPDMMELFAKGIKDNKDLVIGEVKNAFDFGDMIRMPEMTGGRSSMRTSDEKDTTVVLELDGVQVARTMYGHNKAESRRMGVVINGQRSKR